MGIDEKQKFIKSFSAIYARYEKPTNNLLLDIDWRLLKNYEYSDIMKAVENHMLDPERGHFMPKPADLIRFLGKKSISAWNLASKSAKEIGRNRSVSFFDPVIVFAIDDMGGWIKFCDEFCLDETKRAFISAYERATRLPELPMGKTLIGCYERGDFHPVEKYRKIPAICIGWDETKKELQVSIGGQRSLTGQSEEISSGHAGVLLVECDRQT